MPITAESDVFADAIGELANMVAGGGKTRYEGKNISISCPSVVIGPGHRVAAISDSICVVVPCYTEHGEFAIELSIRKSYVTGANGKQAQASTAASSTA
jgi:chemotaxis protein CheX